jgi:hypothetical protein
MHLVYVHSLHMQTDVYAKKKMFFEKNSIKIGWQMYE